MGVVRVRRFRRFSGLGRIRRVSRVLSVRRVRRISREVRTVRRASLEMLDFGAFVVDVVNGCEAFADGSKSSDFADLPDGFKSSFDGTDDKPPRCFRFNPPFAFMGWCGCVPEANGARSMAQRGKGKRTSCVCAGEFV